MKITTATQLIVGIVDVLGRKFCNTCRHTAALIVMVVLASLLAGCSKTESLQPTQVQVSEGDYRASLVERLQRFQTQNVRVQISLSKWTPLEETKILLSDLPNFVLDTVEIRFVSSPGERLVLGVSRLEEVGQQLRGKADEFHTAGGWLASLGDIYEGAVATDTVGTSVEIGLLRGTVRADEAQKWFAKHASNVRFVQVFADDLDRIQHPFEPEERWR